MGSNTREKSTIINKFLNIVEKLEIDYLIQVYCFSNVSWARNHYMGCFTFHVTVKHPGTGNTIAIKNILSKDGIAMILNDAIKNFSEFPALGLVLSVMLGVGIAEKTGYFDKLMVQIVHKAPKQIIVPVIILIGIIGNSAGDAATIVLPPLTAMVFIKLGYHPIAGLAMAYASALGGFSANVMIGMSDALLYAFTEPATKIVSDKIAVNVAMNWYFIAASVVVLLPTIYWVTMRFVIPRLGSYDDTQSNIKVDDTNQGLTLKESKAVFWANISFSLHLFYLSLWQYHKIVSYVMPKLAVY